MKTKIMSQLCNTTLANLELTPEVMTDLGFQPVVSFFASQNPRNSVWELNTTNISVDLSKIPTKVTNPKATLFHLMTHLYQLGVRDGKQAKQEEIAKVLNFEPRP